MKRKGELKMKHNRKNTENSSDLNNEKVGRKITLLVLLSLLMPTLAGAVIGVGEIKNQVAVYLIQFIAIFVGCLILIGIIKKSSFTFNDIGFRAGRVGKWIIGIVVIEAVAFTAGVNLEMDLNTIGALVLFMVSVGFFEEIIYRGLILQYLNRRSTKIAIFLSTALFGVGHIVNLLGGAELKATLVQIVFAMLFGFVCAEVVFLTNSIVIGIVWHSIHNIISQLTATPSSELEFIIITVQCIILAALGYVFWCRLKLEHTNAL
ncbi:CPBP family intramembrane glutamic endopeptidase [Faecalicatena contorta]|nr:CPBP family intramembrane glutamic endopeptidase [Faecalicatena contorta]